MSPLAVGLALTAGVGYAGESVLEHHVARQQEPELAMRLGLVTALVRRPLWVLGFLVGVASYGLEAGALAAGNVIEVAPLLVTGLLFALPLSTHRSGRPMTSGEWSAAIALTVGLAVFVVVGAPEGGRSDASLGAWIAGSAVTVAATAALVAGARLTADPERRALLLGTATGVLYGLTAVLTKATTGELGHGVVQTLGHWQPYALAVSSALALLLNQSAFQAGRLASSLPAISVVNPVAACVLGAALFGEHLGASGPLAVIAVAVSVLVMTAATLSLARSEAEAEAEAAA